MEDPEKMSTGRKVLIAFLVLWVVSGLVAFVYSLICIGRSGSTGQHVIGVLLAFFFGPFYWIYYGVSKTYCKVR